MKKSVLIGSPIRQKPAILAEFLRFLANLETHDCTIQYYFIDDNLDKESSRILFNFSRENNVIYEQVTNPEPYKTDEFSHYWKEGLIWKVANLKDKFIRYAIQEKFDYLFLIDSDLLLDPRLLKHLISLDKDIVSEVFWTSWKPESILLPQVWVSGQYELLQKTRDEILDPPEQQKRSTTFIRDLYRPQQKKVGGLGACTLIRRNALEAGVCFEEIKNLDYWGEDRHFCIRAECLGLELWADTFFPPLHVYRETDLERVTEFATYIESRPLQNHRATLFQWLTDANISFVKDLLNTFGDRIHSCVLLDQTRAQNARSSFDNLNLSDKFVLLPGGGDGLEVRALAWKALRALGPDWVIGFCPNQNISPTLWRTLFDSIKGQLTHRSFFIKGRDITEDESGEVLTLNSSEAGFFFRYTPFFAYAENQFNALHLPANIDFFETLEIAIESRKPTGLCYV